jgi:hypothetical protein
MADLLSYPESHGQHNSIDHRWSVGPTAPVLATANTIATIFVTASARRRRRQSQNMHKVSFAVATFTTYLSKVKYVILSKKPSISKNSIVTELEYIRYTPFLDMEGVAPPTNIGTYKCFFKKLRIAETACAKGSPS